MSTQSGGSSVPSRESQAWPDIMEQEKEKGEVKKSWAAVLGQGLPQREDRNVLEVVLEKEIRGPFLVTEAKCFNLMKKLGHNQILTPKKPFKGTCLSALFIGQCSIKGKRTSSLFRPNVH